MLPDSYSRADAVANIQSVALLGLAFAQARGDLLRMAMHDRIHQPYRAPICPLLPRCCLSLGGHGILGAALSGAGPAVLVIVERARERGRGLRRHPRALAGMPSRNCWSAAFQPRRAIAGDLRSLRR